MKKKLLVIMIITIIGVLIFETCSGQLKRIVNKQVEVMGEFSIGYDTYETLTDRLGFASLIVSETMVGEDQIKKVVPKGFYYKREFPNLELYFIADMLFAVNYYPSDKNIEKYIIDLNKKFDGSLVNGWDNRYLSVDLILNKDGSESFFHYNKIMSLVFLDKYIIQNGMKCDTIKH